MGNTSRKSVNYQLQIIVDAPLHTKKDLTALFDRQDAERERNRFQNFVLNKNGV